MAKRMSFFTALEIVLSGKGDQSAAKARCQKYLQKRKDRRAARKLKQLKEALAAMTAEQRAELLK